MLRNTRTCFVHFTKMQKMIIKNMAIQLDSNDWSISAPQPGTKGGKPCLISNQNKPIEINLGLGNPWNVLGVLPVSMTIQLNLESTWTSL